jgi:uncharacterized damage-inducible protein DinB
MNSQTMLEALFGFNQAMNERLWEIVMAHVTEEQFVEEDPYSRGSLHNQLLHMANAQRFWQRGLLGRRDLPAIAAEEYGTRAAARAICQQADEEIVATVRGLSEAELERVPDGWGQPVWVGLLQNALHGVDHRAQILRALHDLGAPTFEQSFVTFMEYRQPMTVAELAGQIGAKRAEWDRLLGQAGERMDEPLADEWTVRDAVAVVTWKERQAVEMMRQGAVLESSFGALPAAEQARMAEAGRALPLAELLAEHRAAHEALLEALSALSDEELNAADVPGLEPDERFWKAIASATWWSYPVFTGALRRLLEAG